MSLFFLLHGKSGRQNVIIAPTSTE